MTVNTSETIEKQDTKTQEEPNKDNVSTSVPSDKSTDVVAETKEVAEETPEQINWKKFREQREIERKEKEAAQKEAKQKAAEAAALKEAMEAILSKNETPPQQKKESSYFDYDDESEEDKIAKKVDEILKKRDAEEAQKRQHQEAEELPHRLKTSFTDFNNIVTTENLDYLEYHYPEVAQAFKDRPDNFDKWAGVYHTVKKLIPNINNRKDSQQADKNLAKPQSASVPGIAPTGEHAPIQLSEERRKQNWSRMRKTMKGG